MSTCLAAMLLAGALAGCGDDDPVSPDGGPPGDPDAMPQEPSLENVQNLFNRSCVGSTCHVDFANEPGGALDLREGIACSNLIQIGSVEVPEQTLLVPGNPALSYLLCKSTPGCADLPDRAILMPPPGGLGATDIDLLSRWIAAGAPGCNTGADTTAPAFDGAKAAEGQAHAINLTWEAAIDDVTQPEEIVYLVYQATQAGAQDFTQPPVLETAPGATSVVVGGLAVSTQYFYVVRARDAAGNTDLNSEEITATTLAVEDSTPPTFAGATAATALGATVVNVTWAAASDDLSPAGDISYNVYVAEATGGQDFGTPRVTTPAGATSAQITRLRAGTTYFIVVRAQDRALNEDQNTVEVQATTDGDIFFPQDVQPILTARCTNSICHDASLSAQSLRLTEGSAHESLVGADATQCTDARLRVDPENPDNSYLLDKLLGQNLCTGEAMPRIGPPLEADEIATIQQWIAEGAPAE